MQLSSAQACRVEWKSYLEVHLRSVNWSKQNWISADSDPGTSATAIIELLALMWP